MMNLSGQWQCILVVPKKKKKKKGNTVAKRDFK